VKFNEEINSTIFNDKNSINNNNFKLNNYLSMNVNKTSYDNINKNIDNNNSPIKEKDNIQKRSILKNLSNKKEQRIKSPDKNININIIENYNANNTNNNFFDYNSNTINQIDKESSFFLNENKNDLIELEKEEIENIENEGKNLINKLEEKKKKIKKDKFQLIPRGNQGSKFFKDDLLKTVFKNCNTNLNVTKRLFNFIGSNNKKPKSEVKQEMKKKEKMENFERNIKMDFNMKNKVFIYGEDGGNGGHYVTGDFGPFQRYQFISKISSNMAINHRNFLIDILDYDYSKDEDYVYKKELQDKYFAIQKELEKDLLGKKHNYVDDLLDESNKKWDILLHRIDNDLSKLNKELRPSEEVMIEIKEKLEKVNVEKEKKLKRELKSQIEIDLGKTMNKRKYK
jgi:hypothetical protein